MISGAQLKNAIISGSNNISKYKKQINELNIFPVPDGDTGTNMSMTIGAAAEEMQRLEDTATAAQAAKKAASSMLRGARGNSGVILSLLFRGISKGLEGREEISAEDLVAALELGVDEAYKAVMKPTEGTILTVARVAGERAREALELGSDPVQVWDAACMGAADALEETPELLPVLKKAGVVDAGGQGLCLIFEGMLSVFRSGIVLESGLSEEERAQETAEFFRNVAASSTVRSTLPTARSLWWAVTRKSKRTPWTCGCFWKPLATALWWWTMRRLSKPMYTRKTPVTPFSMPCNTVSC